MVSLLSPSCPTAEGVPSTELGVQPSSPGFPLGTALTSMTKPEHQRHPTEPLPTPRQWQSWVEGDAERPGQQLREAVPRLRADLPGDMQLCLGSELLLWLYFGKSVRPGVSAPSHLPFFVFGQ